MPLYTCFVTLLAVCVYFSFALRVAVAHRRYGVQLPAMSGHPDFERVYRVHANTLEWMPIFLPCLWLCALLLNDSLAAAVGLLWVVARLLYAAGYAKAVEKRLPGFLLQALSCVLLFIGSVVGLVMHLGNGGGLHPL
jgi:glutathione S-transferase